MKISTETSACATLLGKRKTIELVAKSGFDAWDFSMFDIKEPFHPLAGDGWRDIVREYRRIGEDNGIVCNQSHAPFPSCAEGMERLVIRALECTAAAGGEICVVHPDNDKTAEENAEFYLRLLPIAKDLGVKIATENMWNWDRAKDHAAAAACSHHDDFLKHVELVNDEYLVACLDIGHAEMKGLDTSAVQMIYTLKKHIKALHIHDNDRWHDSHAMPYTMDIEFSPIIKALHDVGYSGYFTLGHLGSFEGGAEAKMKQMAQTARKMANEFESL